MTSLFDLTGKVAMVTGANTGIGQALAVSLASAGATIITVSRSNADETAKQITELGQRCIGLTADLSSTDGIPNLIQQAIQAVGHIDILVNNAGIIKRNPALEYTEADWDAVMNVNLKSVFFLSQAVAKHMTTRGGGKIINIASMLSFQGGLRVAAYTASKSAIAGITRLSANEWASRNINVNAIAPGYIETNNTAPLREDEARNKYILARIPAGRWGKPEDIGGAAIFLASHAADYMHGAIVPVDGGWLAS